MINIKNKRNEISSLIRENYIEIFEDENIPKYILGINKYSEILHSFLVSKKITLSGFIDDYTNEKVHSDIKIFKMEEIKNKDSVIFSCVVDGKPITARNKLIMSGFYRIIDYYQLLVTFPFELKTIDFCSDNQKDIIKNIDKYKWLHNNLYDDFSKETLDLLVDFRYNFDLNAMKSFKLRLEMQYFEDFIKLSNNEIFVDGGGFDGGTTKKFIDLCSDYKEIYFFEPNPLMLDNAKSNLSDYKNIKYYNKGLWDENTKLNFDDNLGSASKISNTGNKEINVIKLDDIVDSPVTYIKLDIEGAEYNAIKGAEKTIIKYKPKLAICVYHNQSDFWRVPLLIKQFRSDYKIVLRHYTEGILETVMYFI